MNADNLENEFEKALSDVHRVWDTAMEELTSLKGETESELEQLRSEKEDLQEKYNNAQAKIDKIEDQLADTVSQMEKLTKTKTKGIDAMKLLEVYLVLMENVFESQAHTQLLIMLHGDKDVFTLDELTKAAGISQIQLKQAIFDLRNSELVSYDDETQEVELLMRFM